MDRIYDVIIIGGGPCGYTAALYAARGGLDTLVIEKMGPGGQMALTGDIDNYPGFEEGIDGFTLGMKMQQGAERFGVQTVYAQAEKVDADEPIKKVTASGIIYYGKTLIIATGANPRKLGLPREERLIGKGVHYCAHCDGMFYKDKTVMVVGGGNSAVADALYLSRLAKKVYVVHRRDTLRAAKIYRDSLMNAENVTLLWNKTVKELHGEERITGAVLEDTRDQSTVSVETDAVFISIGRDPATEIIKGLVTLDEQGYVVADETTRTNVPGVFAAGDLRTKDLRQVVTAVADGATAAYYAEEFINGEER